jgi:CheY-like chemotaxis protein
VVIALTANTLESDRQRAREAGMDDHLAKPISLGALAERLQGWLERIRAAAHAAEASRTRGRP